MEPAVRAVRRHQKIRTRRPGKWPPFIRTARAPSAMDRPPRMADRPRCAASAPSRLSASGTFGVTDPRGAADDAAAPAARSPRASRAPVVATSTGSSTTDARVPRESSRDRAHDGGRREHADLDRSNAEVGEDGIELRRDDRSAQRLDRGTSREFCAVTAVTRKVPCTPCAANVRRSA